MLTDSLAVCSATGAFHVFDEPSDVVFFLKGKTTRSWNVYKEVVAPAGRSTWILVPIEDGMTASQLRDTIQKA